MDDYWTRSGIETEIRRGRMRRYGPSTYTRELRRGRVADSAVFSLEPLPGSTRQVTRPVRLHVQARTGVSLFSRYRDRTGRLQEGVQDDQIAIAGWSARYAVRGTDLSVGDNGEIIYDSPNAALTMLPYLERHRNVVRLEKTTQFQSYLLEVPLRPAGQVRLPRQRTVAAVSWRRNQTFGRGEPGADPHLLAKEYVVHFIVPNAVPPAGLTSAMWRVFLGH